MSTFQYISTYLMQVGSGENHFAAGLAIVYSRTGAHAITAINACKQGWEGGSG